MSDKIRLDELLVYQKLSESRSKARALILEGKVEINGQICTKPSKLFHPNTPITSNAPHQFVSRGGEKLQIFLNQTEIRILSRYCLDVGASTGGFTDCLLQNGAEHVTAIDVGHGQLHPSLAQNQRVTSIEGINARIVSKQDLISAQNPTAQFDLITVDLSFISLTLVLQNLWKFLKPQGLLIILIKPQFEAGKEIMDACKGVIKDPKIHKQILQNIAHWIQHNLSNAFVAELLPSEIIGGDGNQEFLATILKNS